MANAVGRDLDFGCGDWQFSRLVDWHGASYVGMDIVPSVIQHNRERYGGPGVEFMVTPEDPSRLPDAELLICKDILQHLPNVSVQSLGPRR